MDLNAGATGGPLIEKLRDTERYVHATVAHHRPKIVVPVGAMNGMPTPREIHNPWDIGHIVVLATEHTRHSLRFQFVLHMVGSWRGVEPWTPGADVGLGDSHSSLPSELSSFEHLVGGVIEHIFFGDGIPEICCLARGFPKILEPELNGVLSFRHLSLI